MNKYLHFAALSLMVFSLCAAETLPRIDGSSAAWKKIPARDFLCWQTNEKPDIPTSAKLGCDDSRLYIKVDCAEPNMTEAKQAVRYTRHDAPVWGNECVELFISSSKMAPAYFQLVVDIHNQTADMCSNDPAFPRPSEWNVYWNHSVEYRENGYTVNFAIPWKSLGITPGNERDVKINISRMRFISPAGRFVLSPRTTKQLHKVENYLDFTNLNIAAPMLSAAAINSTPQEGKNRISLKISSISDKELSGKLELRTANSAGVECIRKVVPVKIPAKATVETIFDWLQPEAGFFPLRVIFRGDGNTVCDLYETTLRFNRPLELNETHPVITAGKSYAIYSRIFTPGNKHRLDIKIIDADKKIAAESTIFHQGIGEGFLPLPCQKLNPGHYEVEITLDKNFTEKIKLWINPEIIR